MNLFFITVSEEGKLVLSWDRQDDTAREEVEITSYEQLRNIVGDGQLMCSSTLDFPDEYTEDRKVIALCDVVRGGEVDDPELLKQIMTIAGA